MGSDDPFLKAEISSPGERWAVQVNCGKLQLPDITADRPWHYSGANTLSDRPAVSFVEGDLLSQDVDAIVNPWNQNIIPYWLLLPNGVSGEIKRKAGAEPFRELERFGVMSLGSARLTGPGRLSCRAIIHVAGIDLFWRSSEQSVRNSVISALKLANHHKFKSVAFPAIGAGSIIVFGGKEVAVWGVSVNRSLGIIAEEARRSNYSGRVVIVRYGTNF